MRDATLITLVGLICITILELYALHKNVDGQILSVVIGGIMSLVGYWVGRRK